MTRFPKIASLWIMWITFLPLISTTAASARCSDLIVRQYVSRTQTSLSAALSKNYESADAAIDVLGFEDLWERITACMQTERASSRFYGLASLRTMALIGKGLAEARTGNLAAGRADEENAVRITDTLKRRMPSSSAQLSHLRAMATIALTRIHQMQARESIR